MSPKYLTNVIKTLGISTPKESSAFREVFENYISNFGGWLEREEAHFLHELAKLIAPDSVIVEIGSYEGKSTIALTSGIRYGAITYAVDPHTGDITEADTGIEVDTYDAFRSNIASTGLAEKIVTMRMTSVVAAEVYKGGPIGLLFIDGWHSTDAVIEDIESWLPFLHPEGIVVFDDWADEDVYAGLISRKEKLPKLLGAVGKDLAFTNSSQVRKSTIGRYSKKMHRRLLVLKELRRVKLLIFKLPHLDFKKSGEKQK
jgi:predicted O-methyltransferase YrrM